MDLMISGHGKICKQANKSLGCWAVGPEADKRPVSNMASQQCLIICVFTVNMYDCTQVLKLDMCKAIKS